jgi:acyl carrier protein
MSAVSTDDIQLFLRDFVARTQLEQGRQPPHSLDDDCDMLLSGYLDSLGLLQLMTALQDYFGREIDFDSLDPEQMTIVGPLKKFVADQLAKP